MRLVTVSIPLTAGLAGCARFAPEESKTLASSVSVSSVSTRKASGFPGATAGQQILAAQEDLTKSGASTGVIDASDFSGVQIIDVPLRLGANWTNSFTLILGRATFVVSKPISVGRNSAIIGAPTGLSPWTPSAVSTRGTVLRAAPGAALADALIHVGGQGDGDGTSAVIQDVIVDGNFSVGGTTSSGSGILIDGAAAVDMTRVTVLNAGGHGILIKSTVDATGLAKNESSIATLTKVFAAQNNSCGLAVTNTNDVFVSQSQFENNILDGACMDNSGALRVTNSDFGGNHRHGLNAFNGSAAIILDGNQFGNNWQDDLVVNGGWGGHVISGNQFIGSAYRIAPAAYTSIRFINVGASTITGNYINVSSGKNLAFAGMIFRQDSGAVTQALSGNAITDGAPGGRWSITGQVQIQSGN